MKEAIWQKETLWVARGENGAIIRVSDTNPKDWGKGGKEDGETSASLARRMAENETTEGFEV